MSYRIVVINKNSKLNYKDGYLVIRSDEINMIHLSEIKCLLINSTVATITTYCLAELVKMKIKTIFCDEDQNPISELIPYYGAHNTTKRIYTQLSWDESIKSLVWTNIVKQKISNQAKVLKMYNKEEYKLLENYYDNVETNDVTNREGHAAKVYFNALFGKSFNRDKKDDINSALNYGYTILLSQFNRAIVARGFLTQLGINHRNEFNYFNFSCDLMEPFRVVVDTFVYENKDRIFNSEYKIDLVNLMNHKFLYCGKSYFLSNCIELYVNNVTELLSTGKMPKENIYFAYEF
jgi:CRISPR-associated endonuclease Cas1 subtype II